MRKLLLFAAMVAALPLYGSIVTGPSVTFDGLSRGDNFAFDSVLQVQADGSVIVANDAPPRFARVRVRADGTADPATFAEVPNAEAAPPPSLIFDGERYVALAVVGTPIDSRLDLYVLDAVSHALLASKTLVPAASGRLIHSATLAFNGSGYGVAYSEEDVRSSRTAHLYYPRALEISRSLETTPPVALSSRPQLDQRVDIVPAGSDFAVLWRSSDYGTIRSATIAEHREQAFLRADAKQFPVAAARATNAMLGVWQEVDGPEVRLRCARSVDRTPLTLATGTGVRYVAKAASNDSGFLVVWSAIPVSLLPDGPPAFPATATAYIDQFGTAHSIALAPDDRTRVVDALGFNGGFHVAVRDSVYSSAISLTSGYLEKTVSTLLPGTDRVFFDGVRLLAATHSQLIIAQTSSGGVVMRALPVIAPAVDLQLWWYDGLFVLQRSGSTVTVERFTSLEGILRRFHDVSVPPDQAVALVRIADGLFLAAAAPDGPLTLTALDIETLQPGAAFTFERGVAAEDNLLLEAIPVPGDLGGSARMSVRTLGMTRRTRASHL